MTPSEESAHSRICLHCCGGTAAPPQVVAGWQEFLKFPPEAMRSFWNVLLPAMMEPANPRSDEMGTLFRKEHGIEPGSFAAAMQGCAFLLRQASSLNLDDSVFGEDLAAISEGNEEGARIILSQYAAAKGMFRAALAELSLADHGRVLVGLDWRLDNVLTSDRGAQLNTSVVFLTLRYRDGDRLDRVTLQVTVEGMRQLKAFVERFQQ